MLEWLDMKNVKRMSTTTARNEKVRDEPSPLADVLAISERETA